MIKNISLRVVLAVFGFCVPAIVAEPTSVDKTRGRASSTSSSSPAEPDRATGSQPAEAPVVVSGLLDLKAACGADSCERGVHGGTQSRICRTSHGAYAAFLGEDNGGTVFHLVRIHEEKATLLHTAVTSLSGSDSVHVLADADEEIYAITPGTVTVAGKACASLGVHHLNRKTGALTDYRAEIPFDHGVSFGYSSACIDTARNRIYAVYSGGDAPGYFAWYTFDLTTMTWLPAGKVIDLKYRHCYNYCFADGRGGMTILSERDILNATAGVTKADTNRKGNANYVWDELRLFYIDDLTLPQYTTVDVERAAYDKPAGLYPTVQNNYGGDTYIDRDGNVHVLYTSNDNNSVRGTVLRHACYDARRTQVHNEPLEFQGGHMMRMAQSTDGTHYTIAMPYNKAANVQIWRATDPQGLHYRLIEQKDFGTSLAPTYAGLAVSCPRNGSLQDNIVDCLFPVNHSYYYFSIDLARGKEAHANGK